MFSCRSGVLESEGNFEREEASAFATDDGDGGLAQ